MGMGAGDEMTWRKGKVGVDGVAGDDLLQGQKR